jgi:succinate dehydrogenase/fumarate reductase flavoprotein subunit
MTEKCDELVPADSVPEWHDEADVLVVGFGAAGSCAAIEARGEGADVLVLERASGVSGTTCAATGHFYLGGGTRVQKANGIEDTAEDMFQYLMANTPEPEEEKIRLYCESSVAHFNWLVEQGVPFNDGFYRKKHFEQPTDECLIWSGNEKAWPFSERAKPAPRGHKVEKVGSEGGGLVMRKLTARAEDIGVRFQFDARVRNLVADEGGRICGLRYTRFKEERFVRARRGVVLAAGGFAMNQEMLERYCPRLAEQGVYKQGNPNDDGAGICMGMAAGGQAIHMDGALITAPFYPPESLLKGILVNKYGKRFINEDSYHARTMSACLEQPEGIAYLIADNATFGRPELQLQELIDAWETVEEMEADLGLPEGSLQRTMAEYNRHAANGEDPEFHKYRDWLAPLEEAPYAAIQCSFNKSVYVGFTLGGLRVSSDAEVLDTAGTAVPGLYAAGACASNIAQDGAGYSSGTAIGESTFFGRRAGRHAAHLQPVAESG